MCSEFCTNWTAILTSQMSLIVVLPDQEPFWARLTAGCLLAPGLCWSHACSGHLCTGLPQTSSQGSPCWNIMQGGSIQGPKLICSDQIQFFYFKNKFSQQTMCDCFQLTQEFQGILLHPIPSCTASGLLVVTSFRLHSRHLLLTKSQVQVSLVKQYIHKLGTYLHVSKSSSIHFHSFIKNCIFLLHNPKCTT